MSKSVPLPGGTGNPLRTFLNERGLPYPFVYDVKLFGALNEYYADKPLVPAARKYTPEALGQHADRRLKPVLALKPNWKGLECLEVGCGRGECSVRMAELGQCRVTGVDIKKYPEWEERQNLQTRLMALDITHNPPFTEASFDFILSFTVLEHVADPQAMLRTLAALLKPGGGIYFTANLYRGPKASHRYREVFFPWPHLLFADEVFMEYYRSLGRGANVRPAWVNKMTHLHYLSLLEELSLKIAQLSYSKADDSIFRNCFIEKLGRYPPEDLSLDFIRVYAANSGGQADGRR